MSHIQEPGKCYARDPGPVQFHSSADCKRIFSIVRKNKTEFRPSLSTKVLSSLATQKLSMAAHGNTLNLLVKAKKAKAAKLASSNWSVMLSIRAELPVNSVIMFN